jgi:hypothetical protein
MELGTGYIQNYTMYTYTTQNGNNNKNYDKKRKCSVLLNTSTSNEIYICI